MVGLPFGSLHSKKSSGEKIDIPSTLRMHRNEQIVKMYSKYLNDNRMEDQKLSRSTLLKILQVCGAYRRRSITCIDYFASDAHEVCRTRIYVFIKTFLGI